MAYVLVGVLLVGAVFASAVIASTVRGRYGDRYPDDIPADLPDVRDPEQLEEELRRLRGR